MIPNYKKRILWSLVFALAMVASAFLFKGNPALYWIEAGLMVAALTFVILKSPHCRPPLNTPFSLNTLIIISVRSLSGEVRLVSSEAFLFCSPHPCRLVSLPFETQP
jgi:hypothetical protein